MQPSSASPHSFPCLKLSLLKKCSVTPPLPEKPPHPVCPLPLKNLPTKLRNPLKISPAVKPKTPLQPPRTPLKISLVSTCLLSQRLSSQKKYLPISHTLFLSLISNGLLQPFITDPLLLNILDKCHILIASQNHYCDSLKTNPGVARGSQGTLYLAKQSAWKWAPNGGLQICPSSVELTSARNMIIRAKSKCE